MGLSTHHISPLLEHPLVKGVVQPARVEVYVTGGLAKVMRKTWIKTCVKCGEEFTVEARLAYHVDKCRMCRIEQDRKDKGLEPTWKREKITTFSRDSRRRLMQTLAKLDEAVRGLFVTLTYPDTYAYPDDPERWKRDIDAFAKRFLRQFPDGCFVWRMERVDRKSGKRFGELMPHFHLLVFGVSRGDMRQFTPKAWWEVVGTGDPAHLKAGTQVKPVLSRKGIFAYASKGMGHVMNGELGKEKQAMGDGDYCGRWWGIVGRENFEVLLSKVVEHVMEDPEAVRVLRAFRRLAHLHGRSYASLSAFISGAWLERRLAELAYPIITSGRLCSGRPIDQPFYEWMIERNNLNPGGNP